MALKFEDGRCDNQFNFEGKSDEVAVYDRPIAAEEIAEHYARSASKPPKPTRRN